MNGTMWELNYLKFPKPLRLVEEYLDENAPNAPITTPLFIYPDYFTPLRFEVACAIGDRVLVFDIRGSRVAKVRNFPSLGVTPAGAPIWEDDEIVRGAMMPEEVYLMYEDEVGGRTPYDKVVFEANINPRHAWLWKNIGVDKALMSAERAENIIPSLLSSLEKFEKIKNVWYTVLMPEEIADAVAWLANLTFACLAHRKATIRLFSREELGEESVVKEVEVYNG